MPPNNDRFDFASFDNGTGNSGFGLAHGRGIDLRPELPASTDKIFGVDLSHRMDTGDYALRPIDGGALDAIKGGGGQGGGSGGGGGTTGSIWTSNVVGSAYNITIEFKGAWTTDFQAIFQGAASRLSGIITGDVPDVRVSLSGRAIMVDDIYISAELKAIDGVGGILGQAGPTSVRGGSYLPATAGMQFDSADAMAYLQSGQFDEIVTHEMVHSLGFGSIWSYLGVTDPAATVFVGVNAVREYNVLLGTPGGTTPVPVETDGGAGTAGAHWDEATFKTELMSGYIGAGDVSDPLSRMTAASLMDIGYRVNLASSQIDGYILA
jgi:hypothetical protein